MRRKLKRVTLTFIISAVMFIFFEFSEGRKSTRGQNKISISRKKIYREKLILIALVLPIPNLQQNLKSIKFIAELCQSVKNCHLSNSMTCRKKLY